MTTQIGTRTKRNEDPRLLTGQALFVDDVSLPGMLHAAFLRSPYAHARLQSLFDIHHGRQRLVVDDDVLERILGHIARDRNDDRDRLAELSHLALGERHLRALVEDHPLDRWRRHEERPRLPVAP